jgi:hypothetical protein
LNVANVFANEEGTPGLEFIHQPSPSRYVVRFGNVAPDVTHIVIPAYHNSFPVVAIADPVGIPGVGAFEGREQIERVTLPYTILGLSSSAFRNCVNLTEMDFPEGFLAFGVNSLQGTGFTSITIPSTVTHFQSGAFSNTHRLEEVIFEEGFNLTTIPRGAFAGSALPTIEIPASVTTIEEGAFRDSGLTRLVIPNTVTTIETEAFRDCEDLEEVIIGTGLTIIVQGTFRGAGAEGGRVTFLDGVTSIWGSAFRDSGFSEINLPSTLTGIAVDAFNGAAVESITIPASVTSIGATAFGGSNLATLVFEPGVTTISDFSFRDATSLKNLTIPNTVTTIGANAFLNTTALENLTLDMTDIETHFADKASLRTATFGPNVRTIANGAFRNTIINTGLTTITFSEGLTSIGNDAFRRNAITSITFPASLRTIGDSAFNECIGLTRLVLPNTLEEIAIHAFVGSNNITEVEIDMTTVNNWFGMNPNLTSVILGPNVREIVA